MVDGTDLFQQLPAVFLPLLFHLFAPEIDGEALPLLGFAGPLGGQDLLTAQDRQPVGGFDHPAELPYLEGHRHPIHRRQELPGLDDGEEAALKAALRVGLAPGQLGEIGSFPQAGVKLCHAGAQGLSLGLTGAVRESLVEVAQAHAPGLVEGVGILAQQRCDLRLADFHRAIETLAVGPHQELFLDLPERHREALGSTPGAGSCRQLLGQKQAFHLLLTNLVRVQLAEPRPAAVGLRGHQAALPNGHGGRFHSDFAKTSLGENGVEKDRGQEADRYRHGRYLVRPRVGGRG